jgi:hypothetical protein
MKGVFLGMNRLVCPWEIGFKQAIATSWKRNMSAIDILAFLENMFCGVVLNNSLCTIAKTSPVLVFLHGQLWLV